MNLSKVIKVPATGLGEDKFVGIKIDNNRIEFHYPETFNLASEDKDLRKDIISILRSIELAKSLTRDKSSCNTKRKNEYVFPLKAFLWIINDYLTYGTYVNREKHYEERIKGKINWKKTMRNNPAISHGNVVYTKIVSERKNQTDNLLTEIYFFAYKSPLTPSAGYITFPSTSVALTTIDCSTKRNTSMPSTPNCHDHSTI